MLWRMTRRHLLAFCAHLLPLLAQTPRRVQSLKVTILTTMLSDGKGVGEWGFAVLVEADGHRIIPVWPPGHDLKAREVQPDEETNYVYPRGHVGAGQFRYLLSESAFDCQAEGLQRPVCRGWRQR
jgi:hypothetical protein